MKKFLFVTMPAPGHLAPFIPLAKRLVERGQHVVWYGTKYLSEIIRDTGAEFQSYDQATDFDFSMIDQLHPQRVHLSGIAQAKYDLKHLIIDQAMDQYKDLDKIVEETGVDTMVGDPFTLGAQCLAFQRGLPYVTINVTNIGCPSSDTAPDGLGIKPMSGWLGRLRNQILNWLVYDVIFLDIQKYFQKLQLSLGLTPISTSLFKLPYLADLVIQPTLPDFEYFRSDLPGHIHFVGALLPPRLTEFTPPGWWPRIIRSKQVVLLTQGTIAVDFRDLLIPTIRALADEDVLIIAAIGHLPAEDLSEMAASNLIVTPFIPFQYVMPHVHVFVTNGGYGGVHFALCHGVPIVAAGTSEDKNEICARIEWSGVGINLHSKRPSVSKIRRAVLEVLHKKRYRTRARELQKKFESLDGVATACDLLIDLSERSQRYHTS